MAKIIEDVSFDENGKAYKTPWYEKVGNGIKKAARATGEFFVENRKEIIAVLTISAFAGVGIANANAKAAKSKRAAMDRILDEYNKDLRMYDNKNGFYVTLNRPLTGSEREIIDQRRRAGESVTEAVSSLGLLYDRPVVDDEVLKAWHIKK